jgi:thioester reductase-like protein
MSYLSFSSTDFVEPYQQFADTEEFGTFREYCTRLLGCALTRRKTLHKVSTRSINGDVLTDRIQSKL